MSESDAIARAAQPATVATLARDLRALGVVEGQTVLVHTSLSALGYIISGPVSLLLALAEVIGPTGTLVMPAHSADLSDPAAWVNPPVPLEWISIIRAEMPAFDPHLTPTRSMGVTAEAFRHQPGVLRSGHPKVSFAARGPQAAFITRDHALSPSMGEGSPLARLYDLDAWVLLLGTDHDHNTSLHLAEVRADWPGKRWVSDGAPIHLHGQRVWQTYSDLDWNDSDFLMIGRDFAEATGLERQGPIGAGSARLMPQRALVDFAVAWMGQQRGH